MDDLLSDRYVTLRNNRFVIPVKTAAAAQVGGVVQDRSVSGETTFIEPLFAVEMNNQLLIAAKEDSTWSGCAARPRSRG
jgi:DNA mismatch repair protein MutS2